MKSDTSVCSRGWAGLKKDLKILNHFPRSSKTGKGGTGPLMNGKNCYALDRSPHFVVSDAVNGTNTPTKSSNTDSQTSRTGETVQKSIQANYQTLICSVEDFLAKHSQSLEKGEVLKIPEVQCFLRLREYLKLKDLKLYSSKTSKAYSITTKGKLLESSFKRWMNWGIMFNGWFLTANFSEFPRTERGYSLSEILEENVDQKYYLSEKQTTNLISNISNNQKLNTQESMTQTESAQPLQEQVNSREIAHQKSEQSSRPIDQKYYLSKKATKSLMNRMDKGTTLHTQFNAQINTEELERDSVGIDINKYSRSHGATK